MNGARGEKREEAPRGDGDDALHGERKRRADEHRSRFVARREHERGERRLVRQLREKDDPEDVEDEMKRGHRGARLCAAEQAARDDLQLEDRLHAFEDREHLRIDDVAADRVLLGVTPAAVKELTGLRHVDRDVA